MILFPLANANASRISVTTSAAQLLSLINTAGSTTHNYLLNLDAVDLVVENGSIRVLYDGNTPTASRGILLTTGMTLLLRHVPLNKIQLISVSGTVACSVQIGESESSESSAISGEGDSLSATYNASAPTYTDGATASLQTDVNGNLKNVEQFAAQAENNNDGIFWIQPKPISSSTSAVSIDKSAALEASTVTKASAGRLYAATVRVDSTLATGTYYIQFLNASSLPADGAVTTLTAPQKVIHTNGTDDNISFDWSNVGGLYASTGIVMCLSTTEFTKTIGGAYTSSSIFYA